MGKIPSKPSPGAAPGGKPPRAPKGKLRSTEGLYAAIQRRGEAIPGDLAEELGWSRSSLAYGLGRLQRRARIQKIGGGRSTRYRVSTPEEEKAHAHRPAKVGHSPAPRGTGQGREELPGTGVASSTPVDPAGNPRMDRPLGGVKKQVQWAAVGALMVLVPWLGWNWAHPVGPTPKRSATWPADKTLSRPLPPSAVDPKPRVPSPAPRSYAPSPGVTVPEDLKAQVDLDAQMALRFAGTFYGTTYRTVGKCQDYFRGVLSEDRAPAFFTDYFPSTRIEEMDQKQMSQSFRPGGPVELLRVDEDSDEFLVKGTMSTQEVSGPDDPIAVKLVLGIGRDGKVHKVEPR